MIREVTKADYDSLVILVEMVGNMHHFALPDTFKPLVFSKEDYLELLQNDCIKIFVYEESITEKEAVKILGFCHMSFFDYGADHSAYRDVVVANIDSMGVIEEAQHLGIGRKLMAHAQEHAIQCGAERLELSVWPFNEDARAFYDNMGFTVKYTAMELKL